MSGFPVVVGDLGVAYQLGPQVRDFPMVAGSTKVLIRGRPPMLLGLAVTAGGPIATATLFTSKVRIQGLPALLGGAVTSLGSGWINGTLIPTITDVSLA